MINGGFGLKKVGLAWVCLLLVLIPFVSSIGV